MLPSQPRGWSVRGCSSAVTAPVSLQATPHTGHSGAAQTGPQSEPEPPAACPGPAEGCRPRNRAGPRALRRDRVVCLQGPADHLHLLLPGLRGVEHGKGGLPTLPQALSPSLGSQAVIPGPAPNSEAHSHGIFVLSHAWLLIREATMKTFIRHSWGRTLGWLKDLCDTSGQGGLLW